MSALASHMATGAATVCRAWIVRRSDGVVLGFTDHDMALTVDGVACKASSGMTAGALETVTGLAVDNGEAHGALSHDAICEEDIRAGRWDAAEVTAYLVNWSNPAEFEILFRGTLGEISWGGGAFSAELRGLSEALNRTRGRVYQSRCDAVLGDGRCGKVLGPLFMAEVEVLAVEDNQVIALPSLTEYGPRWFDRGRIHVLSGAAEGASERIKIDRIEGDRRRIELWQSLRSRLAAGDRIRIEAGCDKRKETCRLKFDNLLNFRGFPDIPGEDWLMSYPTRAGRNDGGRG
ncbi:DUF2163 domain-containing protein [Jannaschia rubra]|uniref:DUF2163 domain-containing protein n=1 Tax=Jannaschia rubra TaxID=282197 RepID=UPI002491A887|nr:DUF2163 domain-containing protein [Jannaschia rubra]